MVTTGPLGSAHDLRWALLLDRDGVINCMFQEGNKCRSPRSLSEFSIDSTIVRFIMTCRDLGAEVAIVTNQPEIARGIVSSSFVDACHKIIQKQLGIRSFFICPHDDADGCSCRKPNPGLVLRAAHYFRISPARCFFIGDREKDREAATNACCSFWKVPTLYCGSNQSDRWDVVLNRIRSELAV